ncbi:MAG TPA: response regulator [Pirellulales bacterium]|jgi:CheY-like chemotaxis protein|nr:response regulator [Pirellulales bacterium]
MLSQLLEQPQSRPVGHVKRRRILIVDDDDAMVDVLGQRLGRQGFEILVAASGEEGLAIARQRRPDLVVLDLRLPDADGFSICQELADSMETSSIPVIILSGMERPDIIRRSRAAGCQYFVRKPYDPNALLILVQHAIGEAERW